MGLFDRLKGGRSAPRRAPRPWTGPRSRRRLLALSTDQVPFTVQPGVESDLDVEWRIVDAQWYEIFAKAGLEKSHKLLLGARRVRARGAGARAGVGGVLAGRHPRAAAVGGEVPGRTFGSKSFGTAYAYTGVNPLDWGQVYQYRFDVSEMKDPVSTVVVDAGWTYVPVTTKGGLRD